MRGRGDGCCAEEVDTNSIDKEMSETSAGRFFAWFSQRDTIEECERRIAAKSPRRTQLEQYAATLAEVGDQTLRPITPLRAGSGEPVAALLYEESIRALLSALDGGAGDRSQIEALRSDLSRALPPDVSIERLRDLTAEPADIEAKLGVQEAEAAELARACRALLGVARAPERELQDARYWRFLRTGAALLVSALVIGGSVWSGFQVAKGPNLAEGKPWRASSSYRGFSPEAGINDGRKTRIFFHTDREENPWVEFDLETPVSIERVDIRNRHDCCRDRAFPLALEASLDGKTWYELGRRTEPFGTWTLECAPTEARYVRARALKRTFFHLETLEVR